MYNKRIKSAKKYMNVNIFDRREKDISLHKRRFRFCFKLDNNSYNQNLPFTDRCKSSVKSKQHKNTLPTLYTKEETNTNQDFFTVRDKCLTINTSIHSKKTTRPCTAFYNKYYFDNKSTFVTETLDVSSNRKHLFLNKKNILKNDNNETLQENDNHINSYFSSYNKNVGVINNDDIDIKGREYINFSKTENANILHNFTITNNRFSSKKFFKNKLKNLKKYDNIYNKTIEYKTKQINRINETVHDLVDKAKEMQLIQYISKLKSEKIIRLNENFQSQLDYFDQLKNCLYSFKKLFNVTFFNKITDYIKFLNHQKDLENVYSAQLEEEKFSISQEIFHINNKIEKLQYEKDNIMKWIFFQIRIKERKLKLPFYYKIILENNMEKIISYKREKSNEINIKKDDSPSKNNKNPSSSRSKKSIHKKRKSTKPGSISLTPPQTKSFDNIKNKFSINNFNSKFSNKEVFYYAEFDLEDPKFEEELLRINKYKENLIFQDCEELKEQYKSLEDKNIILMDYNNHLSKQLFIFKKKLLLIKTEKQKIENDNEYRIKRKELEINEMHYDLENKKYTIDNIKFNNINKIVTKKRNKSTNIIKINKLSAKNSLSNKINILFVTCRRMKAYFDTDVFEELKNNKKKTKINKGDEIILKLKFIENVTNFLCAQFEKISKSNSIKKKKELKKIVFEIERKHIIKNYELQKKKKLERELELLNGIEERNNKIYFLPYKKVNYADEEMFKVKQKMKNNLKIIKNEPEIKKFLTDS